MRLVHACMIVGALSAPSLLTAQTLRGRVVDAQTRQPLAAVALRLLRDETVVATGTSDSAGRFVVNVQAGGRFRLGASRIGYADAISAHVELVAGESISAEFQMSQQPVKVAPLIVETPRNPYLVSKGFYDRMQTGSGSFMTYEQVRRRNAFTVADLLRGLRGIRVQRVSTENEVYFAGANCHPIIAVDGVTLRWGGKSLGVTQRLDDLVKVAHIDAIEAYRGGSGAPTEFVGPNAACGVILIWTLHK